MLHRERQVISFIKWTINLQRSSSRKKKEFCDGSSMLLLIGINTV